MKTCNSDFYPMRSKRYRFDFFYLGCLFCLVILVCPFFWIGCSPTLGMQESENYGPLAFASGLDNGQFVECPLPAGVDVADIDPTLLPEGVSIDLVESLCSENRSEDYPSDLPTEGCPLPEGVSIEMVDPSMLPEGLTIEYIEMLCG